MVNEKSIDKYINVEPVGIETEYYTYTSGIRNAYIRFRLTNLSGKTISGVNFRYKIVAKIDDDGDEKDFYGNINTNFRDSLFMGHETLEGSFGNAFARS